jgi:hypothetical protein
MHHQQPTRRIKKRMVFTHALVTCIAVSDAEMHEMKGTAINLNLQAFIMSYS